MAKKIARIYFTTFMDVELDSNDFSKEEWQDNEGLADYAVENVETFKDEQEYGDNLWGNLAVQEMETEIMEVD